jgi:uncharacterized SAM-binding protein YcdF (DUF218 family)
MELLLMLRIYSELIIWRNIHSAHNILMAAHGSVVGLGTNLQAGKSRGLFPTWSQCFAVDFIFLGALWPWIWHNHCQK